MTDEIRRGIHHYRETQYDDDQTQHLPDEGRLLTDESIKNKLISNGWILSAVKMTDMVCQIKQMLEAQRNLTASIKDAEIREILNYIEENIFNLCEVCACKVSKDWQALKAKYTPTKEGE